MSKKGCGNFVKKYKEKNIYCGRSKWFSKPTRVKILRYCDSCKAYHKGYEKGFNAKIKKTNLCQVLTCSKAATHIISEGEYLIAVCRSHARCKDARPIRREDL